jgi:DNA polymerase-1
MRLIHGIRRIDSPCLVNVRRIDQGCMPMVVEMMSHGMFLDLAHFQRLGVKVDGKMAEVEAQIYRLVGCHINPSSSLQVAKLLFHELGLELPGRPRMTATGRASTDEDTLSLIKHLHPAVNLILAHRGYKKLKGTYVTPLPLMVGPDGRLHCQIRLTVARTGRMASDSPNLQNIPVREELGSQVRCGFVAEEGYELGALDLSQIEMVWAAELSQDPAMLDIFRRGLDMHVRTACGLFRPDDGGTYHYDAVMALIQADKAGTLDPATKAWLEDFRKNKRTPAKTLGFGILYGQTAQGLQQNILANDGPLFSLEECETYIDAWYELYHGVREWMEVQYRRARQHGMVWTAFGRPRLIPEVKAYSHSTVNQGLRQCGNTPIQGSAGDHLKIAMAIIWLIVQDFQYRYPDERCWPLLPVHDELIFELSPSIRDDFLGLAKEAMETSVPLSVPVKASVAHGRSWAELKS